MRPAYTRAFCAPRLRIARIRVLRCSAARAHSGHLAARSLGAIPQQPPRAGPASSPARPEVPRQRRGHRRHQVPAGARFARRATIVVSRPTLLRLVRAASEPTTATPTVLGVDLALRRGRGLDHQNCARTKKYDRRCRIPTADGRIRPGWPARQPRDDRLRSFCLRFVFPLDEDGESTRNGWMTSKKTNKTKAIVLRCVCDAYNPAT